MTRSPRKTTARRATTKKDRMSDENTGTQEAQPTALGAISDLIQREVAAINEAEAKYAEANPPHGDDPPRTFHAGQIEKLVRGSLASKADQILDLCTKAVLEALPRESKE